MARPSWAPESAHIPSSPGVYRWLDEGGHTLYVGKAKDLRARLRSYYDNPPQRTQLMMDRARQIVWTITASETDALVLERAWINSYDPAWNIKLRHSGHGARIVITGGTVPRAVIGRGPERRSGTSYGPWPGGSVNEIVEAVREVTGIATCSKRVLDSAVASGRACLLADLGKCVAPCLNADGYDEVVAQAKALLGGNAGRAEQGEIEAMNEAAASEEYESAARHRDRAKALGALARRQTIVSDEGLDFDVVGAHDAVEPGWALVRVRAGVVASVSCGVCANADIEPGVEPIIAAATAAVEEPTRTYSALELDGVKAVPKSGNSAKSQALRAAAELASVNAAEAAKQASWRMRVDPGARAAGSVELAQAVGMSGAPWRVECLDIAHMGGKHARAGLGVLEDGQPKTGRAWIVPDELAGDDYASIAWATAKRCTSQLPEPDLLVIDGGAEQLAKAAAVLATFSKDWPVVSLAKRMEEVFLPHEEDPIILARGSGALHLLQAVRDEAHKACNNATRKAHAKAGTVSGFDAVPGIGKKRRAALQAAFGTLERAGQAGTDAVAATEGIGRKIAESVIQAAREQRD